MKKSENIENKLIPAGFALALLLIWELVVDRGLVARFILPSPVDVGRALVKYVPAMREHVLASLEAAAAGFVIALVLSFLLAAVMDSIPLVKKAVYPLVVISQTIPIITVAPLFVIWFGFGLLPKVIVVILVCFFPITISLIEGLASVDGDMVNLLKSMGATRRQILRMIKLPASLAYFFSGLRIAATYSIMGAVIGEWLGGEKGLGIYIQNAKHSYDTPKAFAAILVIIVLSMLLFQLITLIQDMSMPWYRLQKKKSGGMSNE